MLFGGFFFEASIPGKVSPEGSFRDVASLPFAISGA